MIGNIKRYNGMSSGGSFNPDDMFDENNTATEENFMKLLDHNVYDSKYIGYKVQLSNSYYNNGLWVIADVNHDSANTGQTNCYDLISQNCFYITTFGSNQNWRSSTVRTWLNNTFYPGFSAEFKSHILNPKYNSQGTWYTDDYVIIPSYKEVNGGTSSYQENEGVKYPIFESGSSSRKKRQAGTTTYSEWWTRSRYISGTSRVWYVATEGSMGFYNYSRSYYLAPLLRVS